MKGGIILADGRIIIDTSLDTSGLEKGISSLAKGGISKLTGIITKISTALSGLGLAAVKMGSDFEEGMSEVKAISGATQDEFEKLSAKAKEMGAKTKFSASESAEAFKYMAMAGWDAKEMIDGIDGVMNLAAASGEDLGLVSDIVTDSLTAFGLAAKDASMFADVLAKASAKSNTNVELMGETFKYVAPVAGAMGYSVQDCSVAIGLMANSGIKGSQAGTALRSVLTNLAKPSDDVAMAMDQLNISLTDAQGNMKPMNQLMTELKKSFNGLSEAQKTQYAATIAGKYGMSGLLAIVNASDEEFQSLTNEINNAAGASQEMADIMINNLGGDIKILKSALEGLGIAFYESVSNPLRDIAQAGTKAIGELSKAFEAGGTSGLVKKAGELAGKLTKKIATMIPDFLKIGTDAMSQFAKGLFGKGIGKDIEKFAKKIKDAFTNIANTIKKFINPCIKIISTLASHVDILASVLGSALVVVKGYTIFKTISASIVAFKTATNAATIAQGLFNTVMSANPLMLFAGALAAVVSALGIYSMFQEDVNSKISETCDKAKEAADSYKQFKDSIAEGEESTMAQSANLQALSDELRTLADESGNVQEKDRARVDFILNELNEALGTEYTMTDGVIQKYGELCSSIDQLIAKQRAEAILSSQKEAYTNAINKQEEAMSNVLDTQNQLSQAEEELAKAEKDLAKYKDENSAAFGRSTAELVKYEAGVQLAKDKVDELSKAHEENKTVLEGYYNDIATYESNYANASQGNFDKITTINGDLVTNFRLTKDDVIGIKEEEVIALEQKAALLRQGLDEGWKGITEDTVKNAQENATMARQEYEKVGKNSIDGMQQGIIKNKFTFKSASEGAVTDAKNAADNKTKEFNQIGFNAINNLKSGVDSKKGDVKSSVQNAVDNSKNVNTSGFSSIGSNMISGIIGGITGGSGSLMSTMATMASNALSSAKNALGIHSPSRKFRDIVGKNIVRGIEVGITQEERQLSKVMDGLLSTIDISDALETINGSVGYNIAKTTTSVIQANQNNNINLNNRLNAVIEVPVNLEGREIARGVAPYQSEFNNYYRGR